MRFCAWYPLAETDRHAPGRPGVFQVRVADGLRRYPHGMSAMVHYELAADVRAAAGQFAAAHPGRDWWCRHTVEMTDTDVASIDAFHDRLLRDFRARFGAEPSPS
jgi:hypothetical protein